MVVSVLERKTFLLEVAETNKLELLKWAERRKSVSGMNGRLYGRKQGNLEMVKYCVANECPIDRMRVQCCRKRSSRVPQILTRRSKAPWDWKLQLGG